MKGMKKQLPAPDFFMGEGSRGCSISNQRFGGRLFMTLPESVHHRSGCCVDFEAGTVAARYLGSYVINEMSARRAHHRPLSLDPT